MTLVSTWHIFTWINSRTHKWRKLFKIKLHNFSRDLIDLWVLILVKWELILQLNLRKWSKMLKNRRVYLMIKRKKKRQRNNSKRMNRKRKRGKKIIRNRKLLYRKWRQKKRNKNRRRIVKWHLSKNYNRKRRR